MAPKVTPSQLVAVLADLPDEQRAEVLDAVRALPLRPRRSVEELDAELAELAAEVDAGAETFSADEVVRAIRADLDL